MSLTVSGDLTVTGPLHVINGSPAATYWVVGEDAGTGDVGYAANSDRTSWTFYDKTPADASSFDAAYGKDGSGNGIYVISNSSSTKELAVSSTDITDGNQWTFINVGGSGDFFDTVCWANDSSSSTSGIWLAGKEDGEIYRSTDGAASWSKITTPSDSGTAILSMAGNGTGKFVTGQLGRLLISTDNGATFSSSTPFTTTRICGVAYTNSTWVVTYEKTGEDKLYLRTAADSDLTTWSSEIDTGILEPQANTGNNDPGPRANIAAASGRVVIVCNRRSQIARIDVDGTTTSNLANPTYTGSHFRDIATDGYTFMAVTDGGDIYESTDNGETFSKTVDDVRGTSRDLNCVVASKHLPL